MSHRVIGIRCRRIASAVLANFLLTLAAHSRGFVRSEGLTAHPTIVAGFRLPETSVLILVKVRSWGIVSKYESLQFDNAGKMIHHPLSSDILVSGMNTSMATVACVSVHDLNLLHFVSLEN